MQVLEKLSELNKVTLVRIPGQQGISGNEEADGLAKKGAPEVPPNQFTAIPFTLGKKNSSRSIWNSSIRPGRLPVLAANGQ
jgi:ribonuclease HI